MIRLASEDEIDIVRALFLEYQAHGGFQGFEEELAALPDKYGAVRFAEMDGNIVRMGKRSATVLTNTSAGHRFDDGGRDGALSKNRLHQDCRLHGEPSGGVDVFSVPVLGEPAGRRMRR